MELIQHPSRVQVVSRYLTGVRGIIFFAVLQAILASIKIPLGFTPVPLTAQTFVLFLSIVVLRRNAFFSQVLYVALGGLGFPAFSSAALSPLYLVGPTGGYLAGFVVAAGVFGMLAERLDLSRAFTRASLFLGATALVYFCGTAWLTNVYPLAYPQALVLGAYPFIPGDIIKIIVAVPLTSILLRFVKK